MVGSGVGWAIVDTQAGFDSPPPFFNIEQEKKMTQHQEETKPEDDVKTRTTAQKWARLGKVEAKIAELEAERDSLVDSLKAALFP